MPVTTPIGLFGFFQQRALLDVRFDVGGCGCVERARRGFGCGGQRVRERVAQQDAGVVADFQDILQPARAGVDRRAHGAGLEAPAFFVGPRHELDRVLRFDPRFVDRFECFEPREHAVDTVETAAARLAVHVTTRHDRRRMGIETGPPHEEIADAVHADLEVAGARPRDEELARGDVFR